MGVLSQTMGTLDRLVAYLSKWLNNVATGWLGCLPAVVVALLVREAIKLTLGQDVIIKIPHEVNTVLQRDPHKWLLTFQITQYQGLLCENPHVTIEPCRALSPATLLLVGEGGPSHDMQGNQTAKSKVPAKQRGSQFYSFQGDGQISFFFFSVLIF